ncbi:hypothetical protein [Heliophilum fasciatum]|uniref:Uncharacterized protein n=1 Tax=Heliophilum fasciatum TaxID=35700 RepID=A0A4R2RRT0_9FIRM|nr:hypothetical protein [Heliophilum fasciatum]MCW2278688.1 hypothetical protein [Heliophilum fasciatum]TCP62591.1 hypothetical protein EDD73_1208 [Heliophilum fasciatum]
MDKEKGANRQNTYKNLTYRPLGECQRSYQPVTGEFTTPPQGGSGMPPKPKEEKKKGKGARSGTLASNNKNDREVE